MEWANTITCMPHVNFMGPPVTHISLQLESAMCHPYGSSAADFDSKQHMVHPAALSGCNATSASSGAGSMCPHLSSLHFMCSPYAGDLVEVDTTAATYPCGASTPHKVLHVVRWVAGSGKHGKPLRPKIFWHLQALNPQAIVH